VIAKPLNYSIHWNRNYLVGDPVYLAVVALIEFSHTTPSGLGLAIGFFYKHTTAFWVVKSVMTLASTGQMGKMVPKRNLE
jgi:hypothetical protein